MNEGIVLDIFQQAMYNVIILASPILLVALIVGLAVSIFQATTQIQEATLAFVPKILSVFITIVLLAPWLLRRAVNFATFIISNANDFIK